MLWNKWGVNWCLKHWDIGKKTACLYTHTFLKGMNNSTQETKGVRVLWLIYPQPVKVLSGHSSAADPGPGLEPLGDRQTPSSSWGSGKSPPTHKQQNMICTSSPLHPLLPFLNAAFPSLIKERWGPCQGYATLRVPAASPVNACTSLLFVLSLLFSFWHLSLCSLGSSMLRPHSMTEASHRARWTSHLASLHFFQRSCQTYTHTHTHNCILLTHVHTLSKVFFLTVAFYCQWCLFLNLLSFNSHALLLIEKSSFPASACALQEQ